MKKVRQNLFTQTMTMRKVSHWKYHSMAIRKGVKSDMSHCKKTFSISFLALFSGDFTLKLTMSFLGGSPAGCEIYLLNLQKSME